MTAVPLRPVEPQPAPGIVTLLRDMLTRAEAGEIADCIVVINNAAQTEVCWSTNAWEPLARVGALEWAKARLMSEAE